MTDIKIKIKDILRFNGNIVAVQADEPIILERGRRETIDCVTFNYDGDLNIGDVITIQGINLNASENSRITISNGIKNWDIGRFAGITVNHELNRNQKQRNQAKILAWINNNFSLTVDSQKCFVASDENIPLAESTIYAENVESFENVFQAIKEYIRNHPQQFRLGESKHENFAVHTDRPWWSPEIPGEWVNSSPWQDSQPAGEISPGRPRWVATTRIIEHQSQNFIHPGALTRNQYEELKSLIPDTCQFPDCGNNYPDPWNANTYTVENDLCGYHRWMQEERANIFEIDRESVVRHNQNLVEPYNRVNSSKISRINSLFIEYWNKINSQRENLSASQRRLLAQLEQAREGQITVLTELRELVLLDANAAAEAIVQQANQNIEQIKLNQILYKKKCQLICWIARVLHKREPNFEPEPEGSEEKNSPPLSPPHPLSNQENWIEDELENDNNDSKKIPQGKKKIARQPEQPTSTSKDFIREKNQSLDKEKELACQKIEQLLEKYTLKNENLLPEWQNWRNRIQGLNSRQNLAQYVEQLEKAIIQTSQTLNQITLSPYRENKSLLFFGLALVLVSLGGLITWFVFTSRGKNSVKN